MVFPGYHLNGLIRDLNWQGNTDRDEFFGGIKHAAVGLVHAVTSVFQLPLPGLSMTSNLVRVLTTEERPIVDSIM